MRCILTLIGLVLSSCLFGQDTLIIRDKNTDTTKVTDVTFEPKQYYYQYDSSNGSLSLNLDKGFVDTFSTGTGRFRVRAANGSCVVEYLKSGKWESNFNFDLTYYGFDVTTDINGDGYKDFVSEYKRYGDVYFFLPGENKFNDSVNCSTSYDWTLLDTARKIFFDVNENKLMFPVTSTLYTFYGINRNDLFNLRVIFNQDDDYTITKEVLYSGNGENTVIETIIPKKKMSVTDFDYKQFWLQRYKKLTSVANKERSLQLKK